MAVKANVQKKTASGPTLHEELFDSALRSQMGWRHKAFQLLQAGKAVLEKAAAAQPKARALFASGQKEFSPAEMEPFEQFKLHEVGFFLIALAVENLVKGLWVGRNYTRVAKIKNTRKELPEIAKHQLDEVAVSAGLSLSSDEKNLLRDLSEMIVWHGRYHLPMRVAEYEAYFRSGTPCRRFMKGKDVFSLELPMPVELERFIERLATELQKIPRQCLG